MSIFNFYNPKKRFKKPHTIPVSQETFRGFKGLEHLWSSEHMAVLGFICYSHLLHLLFFFIFLSERLYFFWFQNGLLAFFWKPQRVRKEKSAASFPDSWFRLRIRVFCPHCLTFCQCRPVWMSARLSFLRGCMSVIHAFWSTLWAVRIGTLEGKGARTGPESRDSGSVVRIPDVNFCTWFRFLVASQAPTWTPRGPREIRCRGDFLGCHVSSVQCRNVNFESGNLVIVSAAWVSDWI